MPKGTTEAPSEYLLTDEVLGILRVSRRTLDRRVADGSLPVVKVAGTGTRRYRRVDVDALLSGVSAEEASK